MHLLLTNLNFISLSLPFILYYFYGSYISRFFPPKDEISNFPVVVTLCQRLGPFLPEYKATAECSDCGSPAVDVMPAHSSALICPEQSTGGHGHAFAGPL